MYANSGTLSYARDQGKNEHTQYIHLAGSLLAIRASTGGAAFQTRYQHTDALGSPVAETSTTGQLIERTVYEPYGGVVNRPLRDGPGYTGHVTDASTGLSYMQQRYMDPELGMFLSVDPVTVYEDEVLQFNRYRYGNGNPYLFTDPDGRQSMPRTPQGLVQQLRNGAGQVKQQVSEQAGKASTAISSLAQGKGTVQVGVVVSGSAIIGGKVGAGAVIDANGSVGAYYESGFSGGSKADVNAAVTAHVTNANSIVDLNGASIDASVGAGAVVGASGDVSAAKARDGSPVVGAGVTVGVSAGGGGSVGVTNTKVIPLKLDSRSK